MEAVEGRLFMSKRVFIICLCMVAITTIATSLTLIIKRGNEISRLKNNYDALMSDNAVQMELKLSELKKYYEKEINTLKEHGVKANKVTHITEVNYRYIDSTIYHDSMILIYDTILNTELYKFIVDTKCTTIEGDVLGDMININRIEHNDSIMLALYKMKRKCLLNKKKYRAICISTCTGDTIQIINNISVKK